MTITLEEQTGIYQEITRRILRELRVGIHRIGYQMLIVLIPCYAFDATQSLTKELYPFAARQIGYYSWQPVEHAVRVAIQDAWEKREPDVWEKYFPGMKKPPSNKQFIAAIAEQIKNPPPETRRV